MARSRRIPPSMQVSGEVRVGRAACREFSAASGPVTRLSYGKVPSPCGQGVASDAPDAIDSAPCRYHSCRSPARAQPINVPAALADDEKAVKAAHLTVTGPGLVEFFRLRARAAVEPPAAEEVAAQVKRLADKDTAEQEKAVAQLTSWGPAAVPALRRAFNELEDRDAAVRARKCLDNIEGPAGANLVLAATRL